MNATDYRLVSITAATHVTESGVPCHSPRCPHCHGGGRKLPAFGSALKVPPPPDYATVAAVTARCREAGTGAGADIRAAGNDPAFRRAYRALRALVPAGPCRVEDRHVSRWAVQWVAPRYEREGAYLRGRLLDPGHYTLIPAADVRPATTPKPRPRRRRAVAA